MDVSAIAEIIKVLAAVVGIHLNFFELLASLRKLGQISDEEILGLFEYDLRMIAGHEFIIEALRPQGFERLSDLMQTGPFLPRR